MPTSLRLAALVIWFFAVPAWAQSCGGAGQPTCPPTTTQGAFLGTTGEDYVGASSQVAPNGAPDWHLQVTGLPESPVSIAVKTVAPSGVPQGLWVFPTNQVNHAAFVQVGPHNADIWIEPYLSPSAFTVVLTYPNNPFTETVQIAFAAPVPVPGPIPPPEPPVLVPPNQLIISIGVPKCALDNPPCFTVDVKLVPTEP